jgi:hypothetical protein
MRWTYWAQVPLFWWQLRGWFGLSRAVAYAAAAGVVTLGGLALLAANARAKRR